MSRRVPSLKLILSGDYVSVLLLIAPLVAAGLGVWQLVERGSSASRPFMLGAIAATALCVTLLVIRVRRIYALFRDGVEVEGEVVAVTRFEDRGSVTYAFELEGQRHVVSQGIHLNDRSRGLREGLKVVVIVDPKRPGGALLRDLFA